MFYFFFSKFGARILQSLTLFLNERITLTDYIGRRKQIPEVRKNPYETNG